MIEEKKYSEVLDSGLTLDHYIVLKNIKNNKPNLKNKRIGAFINLLIKKDYLIDEETLSEKGLDLMQDEPFNLVVSTTHTTTEKGIDFSEWAEELYTRCQEKVKELTGSKQVRSKIGSKAYSFLPGKMDFAKALHKSIVFYKLKDYDLIEKTILNFIEKRHEEKNWFPLLQYYIGKTKSGIYSSDLVTDIENPYEDNGGNGFISGQKLL